MSYIGFDINGARQNVFVNRAALCQTHDFIPYIYKQNRPIEYLPVFVHYGLARLALIIFIIEINY